MYEGATARGIEQQVFAAPPYRGDPCTSQPACEVGRHTSAQSGLAYVNAQDAVSDYVGHQAPPRGLNLRKFGHSVPSGPERDDLRSWSADDTRFPLLATQAEALGGGSGA